MLFALIACVLVVKAHKACRAIQALVLLFFGRQVAVVVGSFWPWVCVSWLTVRWELLTAVELYMAEATRRNGGRNKIWLWRYVHACLI